MSAAKSRQVGSGRAGRSYKPSGVFKTGAIALAFLIVGYQVALFVQRAAQKRIVANRDRPDTVFVVDRALAEKVLGVGEAAKPGSMGGGNMPSEEVLCEGTARGGSGADGSVSAAPDEIPAGSQPFSSAPCETSAGTAPGIPDGAVLIRRSSSHSPEAEAVYRSVVPRRVESFRFNPNTASLDDLVRLGFSEKQTQSILNYREKGGKFRRKSDFAKSFVVADSVYKRLEPFIDIPKTDINKADSAAFDALPGVGGWTAAKMVEYRTQLHGYSCPEQLMEIWHFDKERFDGLKDLIVCSPVPPYPLWSLPADSLRLHPHVRSWQTARAIVFYREHNPPDKWTVEGLLSAGILTEGQAEKLRRCRLE